MLHPGVVVTPAPCAVNHALDGRRKRRRTGTSTAAVGESEEPQPVGLEQSHDMPLLRSHKRVLDIRRSGGAVNAEGADNAFATNIDDPTVVGSLLPEHAAADVSSNHAALPALIRVMLRGVMR